MQERFRITLHRRFSNLTSLSILLGFSIITAVLFFATTKAQAVADHWEEVSGIPTE